MKTILVTGTDTAVGKTWISSILIRLLNQAGIRTGGYKPVCSGAELSQDGSTFWADVDALRTACPSNPEGEVVSEDLVCPQRFQSPVAPNVAARLEGREVEDLLLREGVNAWRGKVKQLVVEGAGGLYCPLSDRTTVLDLAVDLQPTVVVVAANRLGVISHTRLTVETLKRHGLNIAAMVLNEVRPNQSDPDQQLARDSNAAQLMHWLPQTPLFACEWNQHVLTCLSKPGATIVDVL
jgi:dethiobiotin synthetase